MEPPRPIIVVQVLCGVAQYRDLMASYRTENTRNSSPSEQIHNKLDIQWKSYEAWVNRMRPLVNLEDLPEFVSAEDLDTLRRLRRYYKHFSHKYKAYELEKLLKDLTAATNALETKTQPPLNLPSSSNKGLGTWNQLAPEGSTTDMSLSRRSIRPPFIPPIRTIYHTTLSALQAISVRQCESKITRSASRLKLWGAGLFEMDISLDTVFDSNKNAFRPVRQCLLRILVDILLWEEQELNKLSNDGNKGEGPRNGQNAEEITALLGTDELIPMALESWKDSVDRYTQGHVSTDYNPVPDVVELLFDLLPAFRAMRQAYCSGLTNSVEGVVNAPLSHAATVLLSAGTGATVIRASQHLPISTHFTSTKEPSFDEDSVDVANSKFDQADRILRKLDKSAKSKGITAYAPRFHSERNSLHEFHLDRKRRKDLDAKDIKAISAKQHQIIEASDEFIAESNNKPIPEKTLTKKTLRLFSRRREKYISKNTKRADNFISALNSTNMAMRKILHDKDQATEVLQS
ncbi:hypothetical protein BDR22DRAFT_894850 [Usnea florida]